MSFAADLARAARDARDEVLRFNLNQTADRLVVANEVYAQAPTIEALREVNGLVARGQRLLGFPPGRAGASASA